jgi:transposase
VGVLAEGIRLRQWYDMLAPITRLAVGRSVGKSLACLARRTWVSERDRLVEGCTRQLLGASAFWGAQTGPNPTDRGKNGSKRHVVCDGQGTPLAITHTGANVHDSERAVALIDAIPPIKCAGGGRRKRPESAYADRAYDAEEKIRVALRQRRIKPFIAKRNTEHGSGLGKHRCVVEWLFAWLFNFRRLRVRYEKRDDIHTAFLALGCLLICWNRIEGFC